MDHSDTSHWNERWAILISHVLIILMMVCLATSMTQFIGRFLSLSKALPLWGGLIAGEAFLSCYVTRSKTPFSSEWLLARGAEWVVLMAVIKFIIEIDYGIQNFLEKIPGWEQNFLWSIFTGEYLCVLFVLFSVWIISTLYSSDLIELAVNNSVQQSTRKDFEQTGQVRPSVPYYRVPIDDETIPSNRRKIHNGLLSRTFTVGVVMAILAGILRQDRITLWQDQTTSQASVMNVVLYFLLALILFAQTNLLVLHTSWGYEHASISPHLVSRWAFYSITFLLGLSIFSIFLPTRYSVGLFETIEYSFGFLRMIIEFIFSLIILPLLLIIHFLFMLFEGGKEGVDSDEITPIIPETPSPDKIVNANLPWWDIVKSFLFWGVFLVILGYALYLYVYQNKVFLAAIQRDPIWRWINEFWCWVRRLFKDMHQSMKMSIQAGWVKLRDLRTTSVFVSNSLLVNPYRLTPRQQVIFFYLTLIRRGAEAGYPRQKSQTPSEYTWMLGKGLPEQKNDLHEMAESFINARYSQHEITKEQVSRIKHAWERVRGVLYIIRKRMKEV